MKKIYILLFAIMITSLSFGQELLTDGGLENWTDATTLADWDTYGGYTQETTDFHGGANAAKRDAASGTKKISQMVNVVAGDNYTVSIWYKVISGDDSDVRIWAKWKDASDVYTADQSPELVGPNNSYLPSNTGAWTEYTATLNAPADAATLKFEVRSYAGSVVIFDDLSFMHNAVAQPSISISSPAPNADVSSNVTVAYTISNFNVATAGNGDGHFHWELDADGTSTPVFDNTGTLELTGLTPGAHTLVLDLRHDDHSPLDPAIEASVTFNVLAFTQVADIAALRAGTVGDAFELTGEAFINYATPTYRNQKWIQDATAGILVDDTSSNITAGDRGDGLSGIKGVLGEYKGMLQFIPSEDATLVSPSTLTITPEEVTLADLTSNFDDYEAKLVKVVDVILDNSVEANFINGGIYAMTNGGDTFNFRANYGVNYIDTVVPTTGVDVVGLPNEKTGSGSSDYGVALSARDLADITEHTASTIENNINGFAMYPNPVNGNVLNITSSKNLDKNVQIFDILGKQVYSKTITGTTVNVSNLNAGVYLIKVEEAGNFVTRKLVVK